MKYKYSQLTLLFIGFVGLISAYSCSKPALHFITPNATNITIMKNGGQALLTFPGTANVITIKEFNGTYGSSGTSCEGHADNDPWSLSVNGYGGTLTNPVLTVAKGDTDCVLTATSVAGQYTGSGTPDPGTIFTPASAGNFPFTTNNYAGAALAFQSSGTTDFYGNMLITDHTFAGAFTMTLTTSDDPGAITPTVTATYNTVAATGSAGTTPAPAYTTLTLPNIYVNADGTKTLSTNNAYSLVMHTSGQVGEAFEIIPPSYNATITSTSDKVVAETAWTANVGTSNVNVIAVAGSGYTTDISISLTGATTGTQPSSTGFGFVAGTTAFSSTVTRYILIRHQDQSSPSALTNTYEWATLTINPVSN